MERARATSQATNVFSLGNVNANPLSAILYPNLAGTLYFYDSLDQLRLAYHFDTVTSALLTYAGYTYDDAGNRMTKAVRSYTETYTYDGLYRLDTATRSGTLTEDYGYDAVGNRTSAIGDPVWTYNDRNELQSRSGATFGYDPNGNQSSRTDASGNWVFDWNVENELKRVTKNGAEVARYTYDAVGRRVSRTVAPNVYKYLYDGPDILQSSVGSAVSRFVQGLGIDEHLAAEIPGGPSYYYHAEGLGSTMLLTDANRTPVFAYGYDTFGQVQTGSTVSGYAFTGREWDPETGLYYYRARYYDSKIGRFLSEDPIGLQGGINYYTYVENDPVNWVDPFGLVTLDPGPPPAPPTGSTSLFAWWWYHMQLDLWRNRQDPVQAMLSLPGPAACVSAPVGGVITGFTKHGLNSVISHPGGGVSPSATLRAVRNPVAVVPGGSGASATIKYVGA